ncbi:hypothetical protein HMPREF9371_2347 [Neisseria shayeganii 871]|uniref:Uncharacterized protein n=1 Tax=Neisseria shayeganii 871 TaxID=1032488 RepID=G4CL56_9NEIS|nr:hypothetical protein HMPREF9371_2347 [Neisseria shayeganii 871]
MPWIGAGRNPTIIEIIQLGHAGFSLRRKLRLPPFTHFPDLD